MRPYLLVPISNMKPKFSTLIILTLTCAVLLIPFSVSPFYLDLLRDRSFDLHQFTRGEIYKQGTGYASLFLVGVEMLLTVRKRSSLPGKWKVPGQMMVHRAIHIFTGIALVAFTLIHTIGASGVNFNAILLWTFFGVTLTALMGAVAETGILESPKREFGFEQFKLKKVEFAEGNVYAIGKGALIRGMRAIWLPSHILLVFVFGLLLALHIFLVYYYQ